MSFLVCVHGLCALSYLSPAYLPICGATARLNQNKSHVNILVLLLLQCS